ncbi:prephenate dehydrogenase [Cryptosporangium arvum]|uniref:Prephenate dehydrogenase n=1 Tax=Cryptosporangium arvum DSM 44712 TaxID=927661 RepID=A0A011AAT4_9ACTN|nr:prephenate dehydrogenase/arogenate dehydrogenase family protein [Cryptosporangium arvum]EXG79136.1 prephenate dehydrogenase [Cryptosporangium arvum DSM 44712]
MDKVAVLGLGLIGGSVLLRSVSAQVAARVVGYDADPGTRAAAVERLGPAAVAADLATAVDGADLVVLAVPLPAVPAVLGALRDVGHRGLLTDVTSVKEPVRALVGEGTRFVGGHPMAGKEASGFDAADAELLVGCAWALCLDDETALPDWLDVARWVLAVGGQVAPLTSAEHDAAVARISHLPHLVAASLTAGAAAEPIGAAALGLGAGSFRDATRVAATRAALTAAMCGGNAAALTTEVDAMQARLAEARALLTGEDPIGALTEWLEGPRAIRAEWPPHRVRTELPLTRDALLALGRAGGRLTGIGTDTARATRP